MFLKKKSILFDKEIHLVPISKWLETELKRSFIFENKKITQIYNAIDDENFYPENINDSGTL